MEKPATNLPQRKSPRFNLLSTLTIGSFVLLAITGLAIEAQRQGRQRNTNANRARPKNKADQCHGKEIDKCYEQLQAYGKADRPAEIIKTKEGLDKLCK